MKNLLKNSLGFGMVEVLIGFALIGTGSYLVMNGMEFLNKKKSQVDKNISVEYMINGLIEGIRSNIALEKVDFQADKFLSNSNVADVKASLKLCWVNDGILPLDVYPACPGRIGYVVSPFKVGNMEIRGLYKVTIRMTHDRLFPNRFKQYEFIVKDP